MKQEILEKLLEYLNETQDFVLEQVPQVIQQAIRYEKISAILIGSLMLLLLLVAGFVFFHAWRYPNFDSHGSRATSSVASMLISGMPSPILFVQLCYSIDRLIKIYLAPKYFLIQLFMDMKN